MVLLGKIDKNNKIFVHKKWKVKYSFFFVLKRSENVRIQEKLKVAVHFAHSTTNQKYYPDLGPSSVWNFYTHISSNLMSFHCQCWHHKVLNYCFSGYETQHYFIILQIIHVNRAAFIKISERTRPTTSCPSCSLGYTFQVVIIILFNKQL